MEKFDFFAYGSATDNGCKALIKRECDKCKFYKTDAQLKEEAKQADARIKRLYGTSLKNFLKLKRSVQK